VTRRLDKLRHGRGFRRTSNVNQQSAPVFDLESAVDALYVVAHPDDTLLFQSPDILRRILDHRRVITIHVAAGDSGQEAKYWKKREEGILAAYAQMARSENQWTSFSWRIDGHDIALSVLTELPGIQVAFMRLPDGGYPAGMGHTRYGSQSLLQLWNQSQVRLRTVDGANTYSREELLETLGSIMQRLSPRLIVVQDYFNAFSEGDHMDHYATACFAREARNRCHFDHRFVGYAGYRSQSLPVNVFGHQLAMKKSVFYTYGRFDPWACDSDESCADTPYSEWLSRSQVVASETVGLVADAGFGEEINGGERVTLDASMSSFEGEVPMTYHWTQISGQNVVLEQEESCFPTFVAPMIQGPIVFSLVVSAGAQRSEPAEVTIVVK